STFAQFPPPMGNHKGPVPMTEQFATHIRSYQQVVDSYKPAADDIMKLAMQDSVCYNRLAEMCDTYGHRLSGSGSLEKALDWIVENLKKDGFDVTTEKVMVPHWVRGNESAALVSPRFKKMTMLGLGGSIATPPEGITADVL